MIFHPPHDDHHDHRNHSHGSVEHRHHGRLTQSAALLSVGVATFLLLLKGGAAWATGSVAMLGSLADTGLDLVASLVTLYGVRIAAVPADLDHRFGHGKAEALAALFQVGLITVSAVGIAWRAGDRLIHGGSVGHLELGIGASVVAMLTTVGLLAYQRRVIRRTGSVAIEADHVHYQSDLLLNGSVIAALALEGAFGLTGADALLGLAVALWLLWGAWRASGRAIDQLMDREWPAERRQAFLAAAARQPALKGLHDLRTRSSGSRHFVQFHVWVDPRMSVAKAHEVMDEAEHALAKDFPGTEILIHLDPEGQIDTHEDSFHERQE